MYICTHMHPLICTPLGLRLPLKSVGVLTVIFMLLFQVCIAFYIQHCWQLPSSYMQWYDNADSPSWVAQWRLNTVMWHTSLIPSLSCMESLGMRLVTCACRFNEVRSKQHQIFEYFWLKQLQSFKPQHMQISETYHKKTKWNEITCESMIALQD